MGRRLQLIIVIMQDNISSFPDPFKTGAYTCAMANTDNSLKKKPSEFGRRIAEARQRAGLTQVELAKKLGVVGAGLEGRHFGRDRMLPLELWA